jgi:hypothetical protein
MKQNLTILTKEGDIFNLILTIYIFRQLNQHFIRLHNPQLLLESMYYVVKSTVTKQSGTFPRFLSQDRRLPGAL